ncbi:MAG: MFS transporter [Clostridia bacterium]|nr:MFS transporter [Clostridia bacterium]
MLNYNRTRRACYSTYIGMSPIFVLPSMLFITFHELYGISYTLLGSLVLINFCTQMTVDLLFTFFPRFFNIRATVCIMPLLTMAGLLLYATLPWLLPAQLTYLGLVLGTVLFSVSAGLSEVLLSPIIAALPSEHPERDMSLLHSLYGWGVVGSVLVGSLYFAIFGTENWQYLVLLISLLPLITAVLFFTSPVPDLNLQNTDAPAARESRSHGRAVGIALCAVCIFLGSCAENTMTNWISGFMENALMIPKTVGDVLGLAVFALLLAVTRMVYAKYSPNILKTLLVSMIGASVCYLITGLSPNVICSFLACILLGMFTSMLWPGTLILMEEKIPMPGVAAYALMAACGDMGASVAPQMLGIIVDRIAASEFAQQLSQSASMTPEEIGLKIGMLIAAVFPILGTALVLYIIRHYKKHPA